MNRAVRNVLVLLAILISLTACDQDPFHLSYRTVAGEYVLHRWEDGKTYYLDDARHESSNGGGVLDGVVTNIGWSGNYIVARRHAIFGGDQDGWMIVNVQKGSVLGPYTDRQIAEMPEIRAIRVLSAAQAWSELH